MSVSFFFVGLVIATSLNAQWLNYKTPGIPRTADGKPNLSAPTPRMADGKPDFSGLWGNDSNGSAEMSKALESVKPLAWAAALSDAHKENFFRDDPRVMCLPAGPLVNFWPGKIVQTPSLLLMLGSGTLYREVFLDGRELEKNPNPDWLGYSVGHWDGDTLLIESNGFNDRTWIDFAGHPHTEALHLTERLRRRDFGHLEMVTTWTDPGALKEPWTVPLKLVMEADTQMIEYVCNENERDRVHMIGKASDQKGVKVAPETLAKYAGAYRVNFLITGEPHDFTVELDEGGGLVVLGFGAPLPLTAVSETAFSSPSDSFKFVMNEKGAVTHLMMEYPGGEVKAVRK